MVVSLKPPQYRAIPGLECFRKAKNCVSIYLSFLKLGNLAMQSTGSTGRSKNLDLGDIANMIDVSI